MIKENLQCYLSEMSKIYHQRYISESRYLCLLIYNLKHLIEGIIPHVPGIANKEEIIIEVLNDIDLTNPFHPPFIRVWDGESKIYGYIEPRLPNQQSIKNANLALLRLYENTFPNLVTTNFFLFYHKRNKKKGKMFCPFNAPYLEELEPQCGLLDPNVLLQLMEGFMNFAYPSGGEFSLLELQGLLGIRCCFLRHLLIATGFELNNFCNIVSYKRTNEIIEIYRQYCDYFSEQISIEDFYGFLVHHMIDGLIRSHIIFSNCQKLPGQGVIFNRKQVLDYLHPWLDHEPKRKLFAYLSSDELCQEIQWILDDMIGIISVCDFDWIEMMDKHGQIPIDFNFLQWEGYVFHPYYDHPLRKERVLGLLRKERTCSHHNTNPNHQPTQPHHQCP